MCPRRPRLTLLKALLPGSVSDYEPGGRLGSIHLKARSHKYCCPHKTKWALHTYIEMSTISITVEQSCSAHPRLRPGAAPPRSATIRVSQQRLFELGSLWLQDNGISKFKTLEQTRRGWERLRWQYTDYLDFSNNQITTRTDGEKLKGLSEIVGVGLGVAAVYGHFRVNLNRFRRFIASASTKRVDFEFYSSSARFFHEAKGTTYI